MATDTIFALSTILGKSGVAVIRISGSNALEAQRKLTKHIHIKPHQAYVTNLYNNNSLIDKCIMIYFKAPHSFTGEDILEFHTHGSIVIIKELLETLGQLKSFRLAEPGEFSKRAFFNNKLDLTQAEALVSLIEAETQVQKQIALRQLSGELKNLYEAWREEIIEVLATVEALIDFPEEDIPQEVLNQVKQKIKKLILAIENHLNDNQRGEILLRGVRVAIVGCTNVGKSSLVNSLVKRDIAIVSDIAGTTRDVLEARLDLNGYPVIIYDTAGIRDTADVIEKEGVIRARNTLDNADICVFVVDISDSSSLKILENHINHRNVILLVNKVDMPIKQFDILDLENKYLTLQISVKEQMGIDNFIKALISIIEEQYTPGSSPIITQLRHRNCLNNCLKSLKNFCDNENSLELLAEDVRLAVSNLGAITGRIDIEEILDVIFSTFCIGK